MPLRHNLSILDTKEILLKVYHYYHRQRSIGNIRDTRNILEGIIALNIYIRILDYYYSLADFYPDILDSEEIEAAVGIKDLEILKIFEYFKQVFYSVKPI